jgi:hypothetical protein
MDMSAPGIQLNSEPQLTHFQPTIRQYLQSVVEAVMSNNLPAAQQAFAQLTRNIPSPAAASGSQKTELATRVQQGVQVLGKALETGDLSAAQQAVGELGAGIPSVFDGPGGPKQSVPSEPAVGNVSSVPLVEDSSPGRGSNLNVRV